MWVQNASMGDVYAEKLSYRVLGNFASARGDGVHEVFLFEAYVVTINIIFLFDILFVIIWYPCTELQQCLEKFSPKRQQTYFYLIYCYHILNKT